MTAKQKEKIKQRNSAFKKATAAQKRVMIAKDVIAQIKANRYIPTTGNFVTPEFNTDKIYLTDEEDITLPAENLSEIYNEHDTENILNFSEKSLRDSFYDKEVETCNVCALGGLFMSCTLLNNNTKNKDLFGEADDIGTCIEENHVFSNGLHKFFSKNQLILIEKSFEGSCGYFYGCEETDDQCQEFYLNYDDDDDRMIAIMQNIIDNNGTFKL